MRSCPALTPPTASLFSAPKFSDTATRSRHVATIMGSHTYVSSAILAITLTLLLCSIPAFAVKCYECNSKDTPDCAKDLPGKALEKDCSEHVEGSKFTMCRKIMQSIDFEVNGLQPNTRVIRGCAWEDDHYKNKCYQRSGFGGRQEVCACTGDLCNSSGRPVASWALASVAALVTAAAAAVVV